VDAAARSPRPSDEPGSAFVSRCLSRSSSSRFCRFASRTDLAVPWRAVGTFLPPSFAEPALVRRQDARRDAEGFLRSPRWLRFPKTAAANLHVYDDLVDAWNKFSDQPVAASFSASCRTAASRVQRSLPAFGCAVDYRASRNDYFCPCHMSAFSLDGQKENEIPPRGWTLLAVKLKNGTEVWVRYQFQGGHAAKNRCLERFASTQSAGVPKPGVQHGKFIAHQTAAMNKARRFREVWPIRFLAI